MRAGPAKAARGRSDSTAAAGAADGQAGVGSRRAGRVELAAAGAALGGVGLAVCLLSAAPGPGTSLHRVILYQTGRLQEGCREGWMRKEGYFFKRFFKIFGFFLAFLNIFLVINGAAGHQVD